MIGSGRQTAPARTTWSKDRPVPVRGFLREFLTWKNLAYIDYLRTFYFSNHKWTNVGNQFVLMNEHGVKNFTNNQAEAINKQFGMKFSTAPSLFENVLIRTKEFKKEYLIKKADTMSADRMRARPKAQLERAERRQILMSYFHNLDENEKLLQLIETLESISSV